MKNIILFGNMGTTNRTCYKHLTLLLVPFFALSFFAGGCPEPSPSNYTVTFNTDAGSSVDNQTIVSGGKATRPSTNPTKAGYTFDNWYKDISKITVFDFNSVITASVTIYAKWTQNAANQFTVTFDLDGGTGNAGTASQTITSGEKATKPSTDPTRTGYTFDNWYKDQAKTTVFDFNSVITASVTIYAKWNIALVTSITLDKTSPHATLIGKTTQLTATVLSADAPNKALTWTSSNTAVATVDANGLITTLAKGDAVITATSTDGSNKSTSITVNVGPYFFVPDNNFREALKTQDANWFATVDGVDGLKIEDASVTGFRGTINVNSKSIASLKGIEYFVALTSLDCYSNPLTSLDVSKNVALVALGCYSNQLTSLDVSKNVALRGLLCSSNELTSLDVSNNPALLTFFCYSNQLTSLDMRGVRSVTTLQITTSGTGTNNSGLTNIKVHASIATNAELKTVKTARGANLQVDTYTATAGSTTYTSDVCDYDPNTGAKATGSTKNCLP